MNSIVRISGGPAVRQARKNASTIVWAINLNHLLWGWFFLTHSLPLPFGGIHAFSSVEHQTAWGVTFITVALLSIASDFMKGIWGTAALIPQQLVVLYGFTEMVVTILAGETNERLILAACWVFPLALLHTIAVMHRYARERNSKALGRLLEDFMDDK